MATDVSVFFSRLVGGQIENGQTIRLTSAKIGAAHAWLRRNAVSYHQNVLSSGLFTLDELLLSGGTATSPMPRGQIPIANDSPSEFGLGIDIEQVINMPEATDYRAHQFYADNFTPTEIAYAIGRNNPRETFCGLWAAKEAIRKATGAFGQAASLKFIEIGHGEGGAPLFKGGRISITHTDGICAAICVLASPSAQAPPATYTVSAPFALPRSYKLAALVLVIMNIAALAFVLLERIG